MEMLEKVELIREKCNVSYEEAREALMACEGDVLDAIVMLEQAHGTTERRAADVPPAPEATYELPEGSAYEAKAAAEPTESKKTKVANAWNRFWARCKDLWTEGMKTSFIAERKGEQVFALPVSIVVLGLFIWGASLWLLVIGLFFGLRYRLEGESMPTKGVNDFMDKAADAAESVKESLA